MTAVTAALRQETERLPQPILRQRCFDTDGLMADRVLELYATGQQGDAAVGIGTLGTILQVAFDGTTDV